MTKNHFLVFYPIKVEFLDRIFLQLGVFDHGESESLIKKHKLSTGNSSKISFSRKNDQIFRILKKFSGHKN